MAKRIAKELGLRTWRLLLVAAAGLLAGPTLPRADQWYLIFPAVAMMLLAVRGAKFLSAYGLGVVGGIFFYASQSPWMTAYLGPVPWLALATLQGLIFGLGLALSSLVFKHVKSVLLSAFLLASIWVAREWLAGHYPYGGYQWSRLAQTQADTWLAKWAYFGGLSLVSFAVAFIAATALQLVLAKNRKQLISISLVAVTVLGPLLILLPVGGNGTAVIAGIQGNADAGLFSDAKPGSNLNKQLLETLKASKDPEFSKVDFVVWPENASDLDPTRIPQAMAAVETLVNDYTKKPMLLGTVNWRGDEVFNTILQYNPGEGQVDYYDKQRPVPFAEYVPDRDFWNLLAPDLIGLITHGYSFGTKSGVFDIAGVKAGSLICFEISIDDLMHKLIGEGAEVLISQANNADFGQTDETFQQVALVKLQAIATGRSIVHISTVGQSLVVHADGTVHESIKPFEPGYYIAEVPLSKTVTPADRFFGWVDYLALIVTIAFIVWVGFAKLRSKRE